MRFERDKPNNDPVFLGRLKFLRAGIAIALALILIKSFQLAVLSGEKYYELSENNILTSVEIDAPRGMIYDRNGIPLATNKITFSIRLSPSKISKPELLDSLEHLEALIEEDLSDYKKQIDTLMNRRRDVTLLSYVGFNKGVKILEHLAELPGISVKNQYIRHYPFGEKACHVTGYVGRIPPSKKDDYQARGYNINQDLVGFAYSELMNESDLRGSKGNELLRHDSRGRIRERFVEQTAIPGDNIFLTIDIKLQEYLYSLMEGKNGCAVVMNPKEGSILALVSYPAFNPNNIALSMKVPPTSFLNKSINAHYPPASTIKPIIASIALEKGFDEKKKYFCKGEYFLPNYNTPYKCDYKYGHGWIDLPDAIKFSCNIYFYQLVRNYIGGETLIDYLGHWGFGRGTGIDLRPEAMGSIPPKGGTLYPGSLLHLGIGQGRIAVTPLQILNAYCALINDGVFRSPYILERIESPSGDATYTHRHLAVRKIALSQHTVDVVKDSLLKTMYERGGTGFRTKFDKAWQVAGKTGTAETGIKGGKPHSWFVCFAPADDPQIATVVIVEEAGHGSKVAAPITKKILEYYFEKAESEAVR